jgi:hypothetical protein
MRCTGIDSDLQCNTRLAFLPKPKMNPEGHQHSNDGHIKVVALPSPRIGGPPARAATRTFFNELRPDPTLQSTPTTEDKPLILQHRTITNMEIQQALKPNR